MSPELERVRQDLEHKLCCYKDCTCKRREELAEFERLVREDERRQTVEAAERAMDSELTQDEASGEVMVFANGLLRQLKGRIRRALLSPAQEVRNG